MIAVTTLYFVCHNGADYYYSAKGLPWLAEGLSWGAAASARPNQRSLAAAWKVNPVQLPVRLTGTGIQAPFEDCPFRGAKRNYAEGAEFSYQRRTRSARSVLHRLGR